LKSENHIETTKLPSINGNDVLVSLTYLAPVSYYMALSKANRVYVEAFEFYQKQSYRNRCCIVGSNGRIELIIPIDKSSSQKSHIRDIVISEHTEWQQQHWRSIESAYSSTPFFEFYKDDLMPFYTKKWKYLWDFNLELQTKIFEFLEINPSIQFTEEYQQSSLHSTVDLRTRIHPKTEENKTAFPVYYQVFEKKWGFLHNLSILDLVLNMGNESQLVINNYTLCTSNEA
jgi:hypothetical protein